MSLNGKKRTRTESPSSAEHASQIQQPGPSALHLSQQQQQQQQPPYAITAGLGEGERISLPPLSALSSFGTSPPPPPALQSKRPRLDNDYNQGGKAPELPGIGSFGARPGGGSGPGIGGMPTLPPILPPRSGSPIFSQQHQTSVSSVPGGGSSSAPSAPSSSGGRPPSIGSPTFAAPMPSSGTLPSLKGLMTSESDRGNASALPPIRGMGQFPSGGSPRFGTAAGSSGGPKFGTSYPYTTTATTVPNVPPPRASSPSIPPLGSATIYPIPGGSPVLASGVLPANRKQSNSPFYKRDLPPPPGTTSSSSTSNRPSPFTSPRQSPILSAVAGIPPPPPVSLYTAPGGASGSGGSTHASASSSSTSSPASTSPSITPNVIPPSTNFPTYQPSSAKQQPHQQRPDSGAAPSSFASRISQGLLFGRPPSFGTLPASSAPPGAGGPGGPPFPGPPIGLFQQQPHQPPPPHGQAPTQLYHHQHPFYPPPSSAPPTSHPHSQQQQPPTNSMGGSSSPYLVPATLSSSDGPGSPRMRPTMTTAPVSPRSNTHAGGFSGAVPGGPHAGYFGKRGSHQQQQQQQQAMQYQHHQGPFGAQPGKHASQHMSPDHDHHQASGPRGSMNGFPRRESMGGSGTGSGVHRYKDDSQDEYDDHHSQLQSPIDLQGHGLGMHEAERVTGGREAAGVVGSKREVASTTTTTGRKRKKGSRAAGGSASSSAHTANGGAGAMAGAPGAMGSFSSHHGFPGPNPSHYGPYSASGEMAGYPHIQTMDIDDTPDGAIGSGPDHPMPPSTLPRSVLNMSMHMGMSGIGMQARSAEFARAKEEAKRRCRPGELPIVNDRRLCSVPDGVKERFMGQVTYRGAKPRIRNSNSAADTQLFLLPIFSSRDHYCTIEVRVPAEHLLARMNLAVRKAAVWGTEVYTDDSDVVANTLDPKTHLPDHDLLVTLRVLPRLVRYTGSLRHGILSRGWGSGHDGESLRVERVAKVVRGVGVEVDGGEKEGADEVEVGVHNNGCEHEGAGAEEETVKAADVDGREEGESMHEDVKEEGEDRHSGVNGVESVSADVSVPERTQPLSASELPPSPSPSPPPSPSPQAVQDQQERQEDPKEEEHIGRKEGREEEAQKSATPVTDSQPGVYADNVTMEVDVPESSIEGGVTGPLEPVAEPTSNAKSNAEPPVREGKNETEMGIAGPVDADTGEQRQQVKVDDNDDDGQGGSGAQLKKDEDQQDEKGLNSHDASEVTAGVLKMDEEAKNETGDTGASFMPAPSSPPEVKEAEEEQEENVDGPVDPKVEGVVNVGEKAPISSPLSHTNPSSIRHTTPPPPITTSSEMDPEDDGPLTPLDENASSASSSSSPLSSVPSSP
ncbi:hypothetical protein HK102_003740 [Quaeritorhiza haematococci]|nr:hypothetical protein HK102_003740 [Quaeritorhiza haematococci]